MKWKKLGKIFDPQEHKPFNGSAGFAQSPQALVFDDYVRVYFSTREIDRESGKYCSNVAFADFDKQFKRVLRLSDREVIAPGNIGCFDEHGIFPMNVLRHKEKVFAWTCGWNRRVSVSVDTAIGFAVSNDDGLTFKRNGEGPVMASTLNEPFLVGDPFVSYFGGAFHMWYIFGQRWITKDPEGPAERVYKIAHAVSEDGVNWERDGKPVIANRLGADECQALPTVILIGEKYHMYFCYRFSEGFRTIREKGYRLGYATSDDLITWTRNDDKAGIGVSDTGWDSDMQCYPHLFWCDGKVFLLYNGNEFGRYGFGLAVLES